MSQRRINPTPTYRETFMKTSILAITTALVAITFSSCGAPAGPNTQRGAATGALFRAGASTSRDAAGKPRLRRSRLHDSRRQGPCDRD